MTHATDFPAMTLIRLYRRHAPSFRQKAADDITRKPQAAKRSMAKRSAESRSDKLS